MVYLDYSATTPTSSEVLDSFVKCSKEFIGNPNSLHALGVKSLNMIESASKQIANLLNVKVNEIIYTSGASESNNLAIKGICEKYKNRGKHIITTDFEHSSIYGPIDYLLTLGFEVSYVDNDEEFNSITLTKDGGFIVSGFTKKCLFTSWNINCQFLWLFYCNNCFCLFCFKNWFKSNY